MTRLGDDFAILSGEYNVVTYALFTPDQYGLAGQAFTRPIWCVRKTLFIKLNTKFVVFPPFSQLAAGELCETQVPSRLPGNLVSVQVFQGGNLWQLQNCLLP